MKSKRITSPSPSNRKKLISPKTPTTALPVYDIFITVYVKNKHFKIYCGDGKQKVKWLMDNAMHQYDRNFALESGKIYILNSNYLKDIPRQSNYPMKSYVILTKSLLRN